MRPIASLLLAATLFALTGSLAVAQETPSTTGSTIASTTTIQVPAPAIPVPPADDEPEKIDWTYRYLIPTGLILGAAAIFFTALNYFLRVVRSRYRVIK